MHIGILTGGGDVPGLNAAIIDIDVGGDRKRFAGPQQAQGALRTFALHHHHRLFVVRAERCIVAIEQAFRAR